VIRAVSRVFAIAALGILASCEIRSHELIGAARAPIPSRSVQLYLEPPHGSYEQIAILHASSRRSWAFTSQSKADVVIARLKEEAAALGANGVMLREITDQPGTEVGTRIGTSTMGPRGTTDLGFGVSTVTRRRYGWGIAIYLPP
jgi:hypothetical protein